MTKATRQMTQTGIKALLAREGSRSKMYYDTAGLPTIGVGHLLTRSEMTSGKIWIDGEAIRWRDGLSNDQITRLFDRDNDLAEAAVSDLVKVELADHQFDTLVSFVFNVGINAFRKSTLLRMANGLAPRFFPGVTTETFVKALRPSSSTAPTTWRPSGTR